ncbi:unnamed protein product [marine sediment metagenome]|uniref:Uncharacterized protein n=1 Tax=marine sediment metagenome TaxID=412755 RepID=X0VLC7_9ZZZZ
MCSVLEFFKGQHSSPNLDDGEEQYHPKGQENDKGKYLLEIGHWGKDMVLGYT